MSSDIERAHSTINCLNEFEPDVINTFLRGAGLKTQSFTKNV